MLANLIKQHALVEAQAEKWDAVAEILNTLTQTITVGRVGGKASLTALVNAGIDPNEVIAAMRSVPMASELLNTLTASGVDWADDMTSYVMGSLVEAGKINQRTADLMRSLSLREEPVIATTADECRTAYESDQQQIRLQDYQQRFDAMKNQLGTSENGIAVSALQAMVDEWKAE